MTWQDELRRLDEEMTAGRLSSDEYQRRRDELMAQQGTETAEPQPQGQSSPFPPAFRWEASDPQAQGTESTENTQLIGRVAGDDEASEQTQVVSRSEQPQGGSFDDSERTQVVQAGLPPPPAYGRPTYQQQQQDSLFTPAQPGGQPWGQQDSAPPWATSDAPVQEPNAGWMMQGPEFFEKRDRPGGAGRIVTIAGAVVVLLVVAVGAFLLFRPSGTENAQPNPPPAAGEGGAPPAPAPPQGPPLAELPGDVKDTSALTQFSQLNQIGYLTDGELQTLSRTGPGEARFGLSDDGPYRSIILVIQADQASTARDELSDLQVQFNLTEQDGPPGVRVSGNDNVATGPSVLRRAHYVSDGYVVRVQVTGDSVSQVENRFDQLLDAQLAAMPANG